MILRRVIEHVKAQNWTAVALDFVIVVVGVFIGIQVSNWNAVQHERKREAQIVGNLISDLNEIERIANRTAEIYDGRVKSGIRLMTFLRSDAARPADQAQFEDDLGAVSSAFPAIARSPTIIELLASGNTGLIRDDELRLAIIKFDREMISAEAANAGILDLWVKYTEPVTIQATPYFAASGEGQGYEVVDYDFDIEKMRADARLLPALSWLVGLNNAELSFRTNMRDDAIALRERLEAEQ
ncbi:hypothetical protein [Hyphococcus sp.]|jgi:hypothetical protein|uniref:hypothetical protein n=1 Tax=Hyphococcus sp. TaxID=2038636 RepID=UPI003D0CCBAC